MIEVLYSVPAGAGLPPPPIGQAAPLGLPPHPGLLGETPTMSGRAGLAQWPALIRELYRRATLRSRRGTGAGGCSGPPPCARRGKGKELDADPVIRDCWSFMTSVAPKRDNAAGR